MLRVLLVDDEPMIVDGLRKAMRQWRKELEIETAVGGQAAIDALKARAFDAVVSDARMPGIDGEAVLSFASRQQPHAVRLVLSGQVDARTAHRLALVAHQFLTKPTTGAALFAALTECRRLTELLANDSLRAAVSAQKGLPIAPRVYQRISGIIDSPSASMDEITRIVSEEPALCATVLRFVNSAFFALPRPVENVRQAVVLIGLERVRELVLLAELFSNDDEIGILEQLRNRSLLRARVARMLTAGTPVVDLAAEGSLLAEIGVHVLSRWKPLDYRRIWSQFRSGARGLGELEREAFGTTHAEVGAVLLGLWGLPQTVINVVRWSEDVPLEGALLDARTATALVVMLDREAVGRRPTLEVDAVARRLGVEARIAEVREVFLQAHPFESSPSGVAA